MRTLLPSTIQLLRCLLPPVAHPVRRHQRASSVILPPFPGPVNTRNRAILPHNGANFARPPPQSRPQRLPGPRRNPESPLALPLNCPLSRTPLDAGHLAGLPRSARIILPFDLAGHPGYYGARHLPSGIRKAERSLMLAHTLRLPAPTRSLRPLHRLQDAARRPVDSAALTAFRIVFGMLGLLTVVRFFANDWISLLYIAPAHHFPYPGFAWLQPWPGWGMYAHFAALGLLSIAIAAGYRYRLCSGLFCIGFTYVELLDRATYLNHYYLMSLAALLLALLPTGRALVPQWTIWALRAQLGIVYAFAGIAKLNPDWLLHALPLRIWLYQHGDLPLAGPLLQEAWAAYAMSWGGALFDLAVAPALLWRRARPFAYAALVVFHLLTWLLFPRLGIFPWLMIGGALIFFAPDWPRRLWAAAVRRAARPGHTAADAPPARPMPPAVRRRTHPVIIAALTLFAVIQLAMPLRHYAYPGNVRWNEEGYRFAWRVMLTEKTGFVQYRVRDPASGQTWLVSPDAYLTPLQTERMAIQPDLILTAAHIIAADFAASGINDVAVTADAFVAFNGRPNARLIDPNANLAAIKSGLAPKWWVLPYATASADATGDPAILNGIRGARSAAR